MSYAADIIPTKSSEEILKQFGTRLRAARKLKGLTQVELGRRVCTSGHMVSSWEHEKRLADFSQLHKICAILDVSIFYLIE